MLAGKQFAKVCLLQKARLAPIQSLRGSTAQHSTAQHSTAQHSTAQHSTAQHSTARHGTAQLLQCSRTSCFLCQADKLNARHGTRTDAPSGRVM